jgi:site-specific DNA recombinase
MNAAIYYRVSSAEQAEHGFSLEAQQEKLIQYVKSQGWVLQASYCDAGVSGKNLKRPDMQRMITAIKAGKIDLIVVHKLDRLTRNVGDLHELLHLFDRYNVKFVSLTENIDTSNAMGRMFVYMLGIFAQWYRENLAEEVIKGQTKRAEKGLRNGARAPYGYKLEDGELVIDQKQAEIVRRMFMMYKRHGAKTIAKTLNQENITTGSGSPWRIQMIKYILENPAYLGKIRWGYRKETGHKTGAEILRDGTHEPIISEELFNETQRKRKLRRTDPGMASTSDYIFTGVLRCARCGNPMTGGRHVRKKEGRKGGEYKFYNCHAKIHQGNCDLPVLGEDVIIEQLFKRIDILLDESYQKEVVVAKTEDETTDRRRQIESEISKCQERRKKWQRAWVDGMIDDEDLKKRNNEEYKLEQQLKEELAEQMPVEESHPLSEIEIFELMRNFRDTFDLMNDYERKDLIQILFSEIVVDTPEGFVPKNGRKTNCRLIDVK